MRIVAVETVRSMEQTNVCFVRVTTDDGLVGLGESFYGASGVDAHIHDQLAPLLFALDEASPERAAQVMRPYVGYQGGGTETRAMGAIDVALWDLLGKQANLPLSALLGGTAKDSIRSYNTCAGTKYVSSTTRQQSSNWGLEASDDHPYEDLRAFLTKPGELARDLLSQGIGAMKIWPFDKASEANGGVDISERDLAEGLRIVEEIREYVGDEIDILIELHGLWSPRGAIRIAQALEPLRPFWIEDPIRPDAVDALGSLHDHTSIPIATGETSVGRRGFLPLLQRGVVDIVTVDVGWTGGLSEAVRVATLADTFGVPIAPHDCTGPVSLGVATHLVCSQPNGLIQESARAFINTWYAEFAEGHPTVVDGMLAPSTRPGHGVTLRDNIETNPSVVRRVSKV